MSAVTEQRERTRDWEEWLAAHVPASLGARVTGLTERADTLVVFVESAAWCARLRFALLELEAAARELRPRLKGIEVRVLPRA